MVNDGWVESVTDDPEIRAMSSMAEILSKLETGTVERVLRWAADRYGVSLGRPKGKPHDLVGLTNPGTRDFAEFMSELHPTTENEKALAAGYWFQVIQGREDLDAQEVNSVLRHLGHAISNITRTFGRLMEGKPQFVIQTHKSGTSKQARKKYRITAEGVKAVERMIQANSAGATQQG